MSETKNIIKSIQMTLQERLGSPFISAFVISWVIWNYRAIMVALSIQPVLETPLIPKDDKFTWFDQFYSTLDSTHILFGVFNVDKPFYLLFWLPFVSASAFIFIYPFFAYLPFWASEKRKMEFKKLKLRFDGETPISAKKARELKKNIRVSEIIIDELNEKIDHLKHENKSLIKKSIQGNENLSLDNNIVNEEILDLENRTNANKNIQSNTPSLDNFFPRKNESLDSKTNARFYINEMSDKGWAVYFKDPYGETLFESFMQPSKSHALRCVDDLKDAFLYERCDIIRAEDSNIHTLHIYNEEENIIGYGQPRSSKSFAERDIEIIFDLIDEAEIYLENVA